jgi:uncharacterized caspase-like protein/TPR repeat protein
VPWSAAAQERLAVVIGNQDYDAIPDLANARNDAARMAELLRSKGFTVFDGYDLTRAGFEGLLRQSILNASDGAEIVFFYAGHGIQIGRRNYLLPADVAFRSIYDLPVESVTLDRVIDTLSAKGKVHVAIIDACRENPFPDTMLAGDLDASLFETRQGFEVFQTPINSLVAFSTTPGQIAFDGEAGGHSPYTAAILATVRETPRADATTLFSRVRERVFETTEGQQVPWESSTLIRPFHFAAQDTPVTVADGTAGGATGSTEGGTQTGPTGEIAGDEVSDEAQETADALPAALTLTVEYDREMDLGPPLAEALGLSDLTGLTLAEAPAEGALTIGAATLYAPTLAERRAGEGPMTLTDSFALGAPGGQTVSVTLEMPANACDLAAGDALDPGGVGIYRLPNELPVEEARVACAAAVEADPEEPRFVYQLGRALQAAGAYEAAFEAFRSAAEAGHVRALNATARLLTAPQVDRELFAIPEDRARAMALLEEGAAAADPFAMHLLGRFLLREGETEAERERGFELLDRAAELGHTYSMNELGIYFLTRETDHFIPDRGMTYLRASAARDDIYGYHNLGFVALTALTGGDPDYAAAYDWFRRAALGGHPGSPASLGRMIVRGQVPDAGPEDAVRWYDMGLERGDPWGGVNAATLILDGRVAGLGAPDALVRAAKARHLGGGEPGERARSLIAEAAPGDLARAVQMLVGELGEPVTVDGAIGPATRSAIADALAAAGLPEPENSPAAQLEALARGYWALNPVRSDVF